MTPEAWLTGLDAVAAWLVPAIVRVTLDGALVALPVWALCRFVPSLPASLRAWMWWAVSLKLLVSLAGLPGPSLPVLPAGWPAPGVERGPALVAAPTTAVPRPGLPIGRRPSAHRAPLVRACWRQPGCSAWPCT
jgi:hypothetical protein